MRYRLLLRLVVISLFAITSVCSLSAQTAGTGALTGTVTDPTGAVVPGATVVATSTDTGQERTATTSSDGSYSISLLPPGTYKVRFTSAGFKAVEVSGIKINVTETPVLNRSLEVGQQAEQVTVEANVETIQTSSSTVGTVVSGATIAGLGLANRNYTGLIGMSAGAVGNTGNAMGFGKGGADVAVNGGLQNQNNFQMDGVSVTSAGTGSTVQGFYVGMAIPNPDTLAEFKIQTSLYDAGYGRNPGANVNVVTKSGTNALHGSMFEFFRNTNLNATDFFRNRTCGVPAGAPTPAACTAGVKQVLNQNQFGGTLGGPIKKDKLFVFGAYQQTWQKNGAAAQGFASGVTLVPIPVGDRGVTSLSGVNDAAANAFQARLGSVFCTQPTSPGQAGTGGLNDPSRGMQVACNGSNVNPYAMRYLQMRQADGSYYIPSSGTAGNLPVTFTTPAYDKEYQGMLNLDYILSQKHTISSRYFRSVEPQTISFLGATPLPGNPGTSDYGYHTGTLKLTSILSNNVVNELRGNVVRNTTQQQQGVVPSQYADKVYPNCSSTPAGAAYSCVPTGHGLIGGDSPMPPVLGILGFFNAFGTNNVHHEQTTTGFGDQVSWTKGRHSLRFGGEWEAVRWTWVGSWLSHGVQNFQTFSDFLVGLPGGCGSQVLPGVDPTRPLGCNGSSFSNIANTNNFVVASGPSGLVHGYRMKNADWFVQDDFKVSSRLTVNLGLRWEYDGRLSDKYGNLVSFWPSAIQSVPIPGTSKATGTYAGWVLPSNYDLAFWGKPPVDPSTGRASIIQTDRKIGTSPVPLTNFAPRVGFAWRPTDSNRFVIRGGGGFFYDRVPGNTEVHSVEESPPYGFKLDQGASTNQFSSLAKPFQDVSLGQFPIRWVNFANNTGSDITEPTLSNTFLTPLVYSWNLNFQYEFAPRWVLEAGYVGSHGIHLGQWLHMVNEPGIASLAHPVNGVTVNAIPDPLRPGQFTTNARLRAPLLGASVTGYQMADTVGDYKYNSVQATLRKQLSYGLTFQGSYTFSRAFTTQNGPGAGPNMNDPLNLRQQYGLNQQYRPHRFIVNYNWDLPGSNLKGVAGKVLGGWSLAGVTTIQSGQWMSLIDTRGGAIYGMQSANANITSTAQIAPGFTYADLVTPGSVQERLGGASGGPGYINAKALTTIPSVDPTLPASVGSGWGNTGLGVIEGPGEFNFNATVMKNTRVGGIHESATLQFRAEFFNLFNHPQFGNYGAAATPTFANNLAQGNFGQITSTIVNPRLIQLALKYIF